MYSFFVGVKGRPDFGRTTNAISPGQAKVSYWRDIQDAWDIPYTSITCRKIGEPETSEEFKMNANYRGISFAYCGMKVRFKDGAEGIIVGHNQSANLEIYITKGKNKGMTGNCHPHHEIAYLNKSGKVIQNYIDSPISSPVINKT